MRIGAKLETVKRNMKKYPWWRFDHHLKFESGEENLFYINGEKGSGETLVFFFDENKRLADISRLDFIIS